ncbi:hypothetical protein BRD56_04910 [Thermoplasmatales archaeon SW_10_69_26]|nr:MAG: hypothetical protein BRD56_04910 [Thermoplasmatales archaeon SW_10_69_26]
MARSVHLSEDAYGLLTALKREDESYSDTVIRIAAERRDPRKLLELSEPSEDFDLEELRARGRASDRAKLDELFGQGDD